MRGVCRFGRGPWWNLGLFGEGGMTYMKPVDLGGGNSNIFHVLPEPGEDESILAHIFQRGWFNHQVVDCY